MNSINPFLAIPACLLAMTAGFVWWSIRRGSEARGRRATDFLLIWPLVLKGHRSKREKIAIVVGVIVAAALIAISFLLAKA